MIKIPLSKNGTKYKGMYEAIVDDCDADLAELNWSVTKAGNHAIYAYRLIGKLMHRTILERVLRRTLSTQEQVDHIDGDGLNNRRNNLRVATKSQNQQNRRTHKNSISGHKGVEKRGKKWRARITTNGDTEELGVFDTPELAHAAYCKAAKELHGEFWNDGNES